MQAVSTLRGGRRRRAVGIFVLMSLGAILLTIALTLSWDNVVDRSNSSNTDRDTRSDTEHRAGEKLGANPGDRPVNFQLDSEGSKVKPQVQAQFDGTMIVGELPAPIFSSQEALRFHEWNVFLPGGNASSAGASWSLPVCGYHEVRCSFVGTNGDEDLLGVQPVVETSTHDLQHGRPH